MPDLETRRPFTRGDAIAAGITAKQLRGSRFRRIFAGVYVDAQVPDHPLIRAQAVLSLHPPDAHVSHFSSARVYGVPVPQHPFEHVTVSRDGDRTQRAGVRCHVRPVSGRVAVVRGVRVSTPLGMFVELASVLGLVDLVVVGDALVRLKFATVTELVAFCADSSESHVAAARRAARYVRERVDSAMESRLRMLIVLAGLPEPQVNLEMRDGSGNILMRFDLSYPELKLIVEYDGRQHALRSQQWLRDVKRREQLDDLGWRVIIVTSQDIYSKPAETIERLRRALQERGCRGVSARLSQAWKPFFPAS